MNYEPFSADNNRFVSIFFNLLSGKASAKEKTFAKKYAIMENLKTQEERLLAIKAIGDSFLTSLRGNGFDVCPEAVCSVNRSSIELGIAATGAYMDKGFKLAFASEISLYACDHDDMFGRKENEINFGSSGVFTPSVKESYWRTVHAASILKNWDLACEIVNFHCKMYADLYNKANLITKSIITGI